MRDVGFSDYRQDVSVSSALQPMFGPDNFLSIGKTSVILDSIPRDVDFQYGTTYFRWLLAPVPRAIWPDKPLIRIGAELGAAIFGRSLSSGIPPGIVGEAYYNFGWIWIPSVLLLVGMALRWFYERFGTRARYNENSMQIYATCLVAVSFSGLSSDFSGSLLTIIGRVLPLLIILKYISLEHGRSPHTRRRKIP